MAATCDSVAAPSIVWSNPCARANAAAASPLGAITAPMRSPASA